MRSAFPSAAAVARYDAALGKLLVMRNDPMAEADAATTIDSGLVMGHVLKGVVCVLGTDRSSLPDAKAALDAARGVAEAPRGVSGAYCRPVSMDRWPPVRRVRMLGACAGGPPERRPRHVRGAPG